MAAGTAAHPHSAPTLWVDITIKPRAVEWIISIRADHADPWLRGAMPPEDLVDFITPEEAKLARATIGRYFAKNNRVTIDGRRGEPVCLRIEAPESAEGRTMIDYLSFRIAYPTDGWPQKVTFVWDDFEGANFMEEQTIPGTLRVGPQIETLAFSPEEPRFTWAMPKTGLPQRPGIDAVQAGRVNEPVRWLYHVLVGVATLVLGGVLLFVRAPVGVWLVLAILVAGSAYALPWQDQEVLPPVTEMQAALILESLHQNIYRAFDAVTEDRIYDLLAVSVEPQLLDRLYLEVRQGLEMKEQGGAVAEIGNVERRGSRIEFKGRDEFRARWRWHVYAHVTHWGHTHARLNEYLANFVVRTDGTSWKIADYELLESQRIEIEEQK